MRGRFIWTVFGLVFLASLCTTAWAFLPPINPTPASPGPGAQASSATGTARAVTPTLTITATIPVVTPTVSITAAISPAASTTIVTGTATLEPTKTPTQYEQTVTFISTGDKRLDSLGTSLVDFGLAFLKIFGFLIAIPLVIAVALRIIRALSHGPELVVENFTDASGDAEVGKLLAGLSQQARVELANRFDWVKVRVNRYGKDVQPAEAALNSTQLAAPQEVSHDELQSLIESVKEIAPQPLKVALPLAKIGLVRKSIHVTSTLLRVDGTTGKLGISLRVADTRNELEPSLYTVQEPDKPKPGSFSVPATIIADPPSTDDKLKAQAIFKIARLLVKAFLFDDALKYLQEVFALSGSLEVVRKEITATAIKWQEQRLAKSNFTVGQRLGFAGLLDEGISSLVTPLSPEPPPSTDPSLRWRWRAWLNLPWPVDEQSQAEAYWRAALGQDPSARSKAFLELARLYRRAGVYLTDEALLLYEEAARGSEASEATKERDELRQQIVAALLEAGWRLYILLRYDESQKYLKLALAKAPDNEQVKEVLSATKRFQQPKSHAEADVLYEIGKLYKEKGEPEQAIAYFESALKIKLGEAQDKGDNGDEGKKGSNADNTVAQRYTKLLRPAARWLAYELLLRKMLEETPWIYFGKENPYIDTPAYHVSKRRRRYKSAVYNFIGNQVANAAGKSYPYLLEVAIKHLKRAIELDPEAFMPYEMLGFAYDRSATAFEKERDVHLRNSLISYATAIRLAGKIPDGAVRPIVERRIKVKYAIEQMRLDDDQMAREALDTITEITRPPWAVEREKSVAVLYNLASWYSLAIGRGLNVDEEELRDLALRCLAYSMARDRYYEYWQAARSDDDLRLLNLPEAQFKRLELEITRTRATTPELHNLPGSEFERLMNEIMDRAEWLPNKEEKQ